MKWYGVVGVRWFVVPLCIGLGIGAVFGAAV